MDPLSTAASAVAVVGAALKCVQNLNDDIGNIADAPEAIKSLTSDLLSVEKVLTSLQAVSESQWASLGATVFDQSKSTMDLCMSSCERFRADVARWTHSGDGKKLSKRDRVKIGLFKQEKIKSMSEQLRSCHGALTSVASTASLHSNLRLKEMTEEMAKAISAKETEFAEAIVETDRQLAEVTAKMSRLILARQDQADEAADDVDGAVQQVAAEGAALSTGRELLEELQTAVRAEASRAQRGQGRNVYNFGAQTQGTQIGTVYGGIGGMTFHGRG